MNIFKSVGLILLHLIVGIVIIMLFQTMRLPARLNPAIPVLVSFLLLNILYNLLFKLNAIKEYWGLHKLRYFFIAVPTGCLIMASPLLLAVLFGRLDTSSVSITATFSLSGMLITLAIVAWEELWFRGVVLNYCNKYMNAVPISIIMGLLFMLVHILNPEINLLKSGPALFGAGALLTITYFYYRTIWVPLGLHFGNNYLSSKITTSINDDLFFGGDGYCSAILLFSILTIFIVKYRKDKRGINTFL